MSFNAKLFASTFILIFLAELGDKTQLAAMAKSIEGRLTVFLAASAALICSTLIAVLFGDALTRFIPERYLQIAAAVLFIVFGGIMLFNVFFGRVEPVQPAAAPNAFERLIMQTAMVFEEAAEEDYRKLADKAESEAVRQALLALADEERNHLEYLRSARLDHAHEEAFETQEKNTLPELRQLLHDAAEDQGRPFVGHAIEHELATAAFYDTLAKTAKIPGLRRTLRVLADEERRHAALLKELEKDLG
jgi:rubrerythrin